MIGCGAAVAANRPVPMSELAFHNLDLTGALLTWVESIPVVLIVAGAGLMLAAIWRGQQGERGVKPPSAEPVVPPASPASAVQNVMRDAEELTGLLAGQMDRQAARLEKLIADADARIRHLERLSAQVQAARPGDRATGADPLNQRIYEMADDGMPPVEIARHLKQQMGKVQLILAMRRR